MLLTRPAIIVVFAYILELASSPVLAIEPQLPAIDTLQPTVWEILPDDQQPELLPIAYRPDYNCLTIGEMTAMIAGAIVGGAAADFALKSAPFAVVGIAAGAAIGSLLYRYGL